MLPLCSFIQVNSSLKLFAASVGRPASVFEVILTRPMGTKSFSGVEGAIRIKRHARRQRRLVQQDRVAVRLGAGGLGGGDHAAGAADVFDHDRLAERLLHRVLKNARGRIVGAAGRERDDHGDRTIGIGLRRSGAGGEKTSGEHQRREQADERHETSPKIFEHGRLLFVVRRRPTEFGA